MIAEGSMPRREDSVVQTPNNEGEVTRGTGSLHVWDLEWEDLETVERRRQEAGTTP